jgi:hypothetical protein
MTAILRLAWAEDEPSYRTALCNQRCRLSVRVKEAELNCSMGFGETIAESKQVEANRVMPSSWQEGWAWRQAVASSLDHFVPIPSSLDQLW